MKNKIDLEKEIESLESDIKSLIHDLEKNNILFKNFSLYLLPHVGFKQENKYINQSIMSEYHDYLKQSHKYLSYLLVQKPDKLISIPIEASRMPSKLIKDVNDMNGI